MESLIYLYVLTHPTTSADVICRMWKKSKIFREYDQPERVKIKGWVKQIKKELVEKGIRLRMN